MSSPTVESNSESQQQLIEGLSQYIDSIPWIPQLGPQDDAYFSQADVLLYGGAAGGGKTALACGLAITRHRETLFIRREATQLGGVVDEVGRIIDPQRKGYNGSNNIWRLPAWDGVERKIVFGSTPHLGNETRFQGRARDLLVVDEAANMLESQVLFLMGWVRSTVPGQRCRTLLCSNPPTSAEGEWLIKMFAPWLDPYHPNPAEPGDLRWFAMVGGVDTEVESGARFMHGEEEVIPQSRTFIPAKVTDNAYLRDTGYVATLQSLPEPLRSQMLYGDFLAGREDDEWQVIPSEWVQAAMDRWEPRVWEQSRITSVGVDPSRGGSDETIIAAREDWYYHPLQAYPGHEMKSGQHVAGKVLELAGVSNAPVHVDVIGIGSSVVDQLDMHISHRVVPVNFAEAAKGDTDWSGTLKFSNQRAAYYWRFRDLLNPENGRKVMLPPDRTLKADLCAPTYKLTATGIRIEAKEDISKRIGRSPDRGDAVVLAAQRTNTMKVTGLAPRYAVKRQLSS